MKGIVFPSSTSATTAATCLGDIPSSWAMTFSMFGMAFAFVFGACDLSDSPL